MQDDVGYLMSLGHFCFICVLARAMLYDDSYTGGLSITAAIPLFYTVDE